MAATLTVSVSGFDAAFRDAFLVATAIVSAAAVLALARRRTLRQAAPSP